MKNKYPDNIMRYMRLRWRLSEDDTSQDNIFNDMKPSEIFYHVLNWKGLLGSWDYTIKKLVKDIYGIDIDKESEKRNV